VRTKQVDTSVAILHQGNLRSASFQTSSQGWV